MLSSAQPSSPQPCDTDHSKPSTKPSTYPSTQPSTYTTQSSTHPSTQQPSTQYSAHPSTQPSTHILFTIIEGVVQLGKKAFIYTCIFVIIAVAVGSHQKEIKLLTANKCENILFSTWSQFVVVVFLFI